MSLRRSPGEGRAELPAHTNIRGPRMDPQTLLKCYQSLRFLCAHANLSPQTQVYQPTLSQPPAQKHRVSGSLAPRACYFPAKCLLGFHNTLGLLPFFYLGEKINFYVQLFQKTSCHIGKPSKLRKSLGNWT